MDDGISETKRYALYMKSDPTVEVHGHGCATKAQLEEYVEALPYFFIGMTTLTSFDRELGGYIPCPA